MSMTLFKPRGRLSVVDACEQLIRETREKEGISYTVAVTELRSRTGLDHLGKPNITGPMLEASKRLRRAGVPGVKTIRNTGWQRETARDLINDATHRERKVHRQVRWMGESAGAADPEQLEWPDRERRTELQRKAHALAELNTRRSQRLRPLPPAASE